MKIGIMTPSDEGNDNNYGTMLQCFALQRYLRDLGHDAYVINYGRTKKKRPSWRRELYALSIFPKLFPGKEDKHWSAVADKEREAFPRHFEEFTRKYIRRSSVAYRGLSELQANPPEADVYICGSDNIWLSPRGDFNYQLQGAWFLDFGREDMPRISYAPSWGRAVYPDEYTKQIAPLLKKFQAVSVREKSGVELCRKAGYEGAKWVCDPTLLLTADEYRRIYNENPIRRRDKKYLLLYILHNDKNADFEAVQKFSENKGLEVLLVYDRIVHIKDVNAIVYPTIPEWLYLIDNAEYILTNAYHGTVFSTIFGKQYGVIPYKNSEQRKGNIRHNALFEGCNIEPRWLEPGEGFSVLDKPYSADISSFRAESIRFLNDALKNIQER